MTSFMLSSRSFSNDDLLPLILVALGAYIVVDVSRLPSSSRAFLLFVARTYSVEMKECDRTDWSYSFFLTFVSFYLSFGASCEAL